MSSFNYAHAFDPLDLEIIDRVFEASWAQIEARDSKRDTTKDADQQEALRKLVFACANAGTVDFDRLFDCVIANLARLKAAESCSELVTQPQARV
jgi:hypothetical protein